MQMRLPSSLHHILACSDYTTNRVIIHLFSYRKYERVGNLTDKKGQGEMRNLTDERNVVFQVH
jgi:hypothetical protein